MRNVFVIADNIISPLGYTTSENFDQLRNNISGIKEHTQPAISIPSFYASLLEKEQWANLKTDIDKEGVYTNFELLLIASIKNALKTKNIDVSDAETIFIVSSTKGNIELLEKNNLNEDISERISLHASAALIANYFDNKNTAIVISNACISGLVALLTGKRLIESGQYKKAVIVGADVVSKFILSGFQSFQAVSEKPCQPFDEKRKGINLGEAAATIILSGIENDCVQFTGGATSNDANHISGPSRTGEELCIAINKALKQAKLTLKNIDFISAHGTATIYNDEMEAKAFSLAGMETAPVNSLKGFYGHTLGAAGVVESIIAIECLKQNILLPTFGFQQLGVTTPINVCNSLLPITANHCLKTASGFGGCNAALVFSKNTHFGSFL